ncbi:MAG: 50S ribosomal protein L15 [Firmicutes bacterium]|nr:50S ribosomal protein L15 [Bacillota bacterium]
MRLHDLKPGAGARRERKRVGRGIGSGLGKTAGKGNKGQLARSGGGKGAAFEGGQTPLQRRLPKRGFTNRFREEIAHVNVESLNVFEDGAVVTPETLIGAGLIARKAKTVKVLAKGDLEKALTVKAHKFSEASIEKIQAAGGKVEVI